MYFSRAFVESGTSLHWMRCRFERDDNLESFTRNTAIAVMLPREAITNVFMTAPIEKLLTARHVGG